MARILVCEDDELLREMYSDVLIGAGHDITTALDGEESLQKVSQGGYDLVLLDIIMPKMSGLDVMQKLQSSPPPTPNKTVVFLTNIDKGDEIDRAQQLGQGYIIKSQITPGDLIARVASFLGAPQQTPAQVVQPGQPDPNQN